jgi:3-dehydroquinate synthase class II
VPTLHSGETHVKTVGRVKVEQRQMVLVEAEADEVGPLYRLNPVDP